MTEPRDPTSQDWRDTVFLPKTAFPMKAGLPQKEPGFQAKWEAEGLYAQLRAARAGREQFLFHDGPPYANGDMHIGHALNHTLKDMVVRTQTLRGKDAPYVPGWDCHGLPIEWKVEEQYRKKKLDKDQVDPVEFRAECRAYAQHWVDRQREQLKRLGVNADWDHPYLTMDFQAEATIVAELMKFAESGQLYRGAKPVMWSPVEKTALAEAEIEYEDVVSTQIDLAFEIVEAPNCPQINELIAKGWQVNAVVWTTTPWTIPVNQALAFSPTAQYRILAEGGVGRAWVIADELWEEVAGRAFAYDRDVVKYGLHFEPLGGYPGDAEGLFRGDEWEGAVARHPMHHLGGFFAKPRPFLPGEFVTTDTGTGLVHMAPDHGEDDFALCKANALEPVFAVEADGKYREDWGWLPGQGSVINPKFNAPDGPICSDLREAGGLLAASADYRHSYPHSWRSKAKVIYRCTPQWFVPMDVPQRVSTSLDTHGVGKGSSNLDPFVSSVVETPPTTLRQRALAAIAATRFVPEKGRNRIGSMVEGRPDWVLSRQRAWGVPITLFVKKGTNQYLTDGQVNARIVAAVNAGGVDAWSEDRAQEYLGSDYLAEDYEQVFDILDVWFDSGCTHAFVMESGRWPEMMRPEGYQGPPADLYLEGSDQHRGWFQSSLLESCATRGHAPYKAVLTHGFTMDAKGLKMSKSLGNTIDPLKVMETYGADIVRLWALSVDFTEDHRIGDEILKGVADQYRKLRNTFRYLLGALEGFDEGERWDDVASMPELERYMLALLARLDGTLRRAVDDFDFNTYVRALTEFCNEDLSAFFFDIRKDSLYCDAADDPKRRAYRTVLDTLFHALVRWAAPVLVFTSEEVWATRFPEGGSVHLLEWPTIPNTNTLRRPGESRGPAALDGADKNSLAPDQVRGDELVEKWDDLRRLRRDINEAIEPLRREKVVGSSLEANVQVFSMWNGFADTTTLGELAIVSQLSWDQASPPEDAYPLHHGNGDVVERSGFTVTRTTHHKCGRCWRHLPEVTEDGALCSRCDHVVAGMDVVT